MSKKKVLIIAYYWPPAGGPGVQRWLKFVKYLPEFNIEPIVFVPENPNYPLIDESLIAEIPTGITVIKQPIKEPYKLAGLFSKNKSKTISKGIITEKENQSFIEKLMLFIRGNFFIPDARKNWVSPSFEVIKVLLSKENIESILTTGPPHSLHLIGLKLKQELDVNWIADFRDPWTTIGYHKQLKLLKSSAKKHKQLERQVLNTADKIIVTSFTTQKEFQNITQKPIEVITNGYDDEKTETTVLDSKFTISHIGSLLSKRNPEVLWQVLRDLKKENESFSNDLQLNFVGLLSENVAHSLENYSLSNCVNNLGYVSHNESIKFQKKSQLLLLIEINSEDTKCIIPGKLFEYMVAQRPIVAIGPKGWDVETITTQTNTGTCFNYNDYDALKATILEYYKAYKNNDLTVQPIGLQKYHRKALTKQLTRLI
ncbi:glycosyl transferase family 1 [Tamlana sedimentorum]|uniref:Glycosyl transferase family 1 n=1 Tax=Neotamlana sedimentorum TaxID=1435349 RepID=A0A0D7W106_9FLAO|nr:glycosyltransferase family 4 protein [Tamlana sedimentorum]KJD32751.1 glycosyl transferase family 1 [Tamlana sedimentorum]